MFGGIDPKKMQAMMKQMGIKQEEIEASKVTIECQDKNIILQPVSVQKIVMQGQETWQLSGTMREEPLKAGITEEDIALVAEKTGKSKAMAKKALEETGDIAEAIVKLS